MKIILNGRKAGNGDSACYFENKAYLKKRGLKKGTILHELFHHLVSVNSWEMPNQAEEKEANSYAKEFVRK